LGALAAKHPVECVSLREDGMRRHFQRQQIGLRPPGLLHGVAAQSAGRFSSDRKDSRTSRHMDRESAALTAQAAAVLASLAAAK